MQPKNQEYIDGGIDIEIMDDHDEALNEDDRSYDPNIYEDESMGANRGRGIDALERLINDYLM